MTASVSTVADGHKTKIPAKMEEPLTKMFKKKKRTMYNVGLTTDGQFDT